MFEESKLIIANKVTTEQALLDRIAAETRIAYLTAFRDALVEGETGDRLTIAREIAASVTIETEGYPNILLSDEARGVLVAAKKAQILGNGYILGSVEWYIDMSGISRLGSASKAKEAAVTAHENARSYRIANR